MHMSDALLSPVVGGAMWAASAAAVALSSRKVKDDPDTTRVPLMGALGAFVFAAQMVNFSIPGTGSSGHLSGALLLAILLGPHGAFLVMASVLTVQALFFADGGLLALGANMINMGFFACFIVYPLIYLPMAGRSLKRGRIVIASILSSIAALELGAFSVVVQTVASGISSLPFGPFSSLMLPIHLAIGAVEGVVTSLVVVLVRSSEPENMLDATGRTDGRRRFTIGAILAAAVVVGGFVSWYASGQPDGLEWSVTGAAGIEPEARPGRLTEIAAGIQEKLLFLPDYGFRAGDAERSGTTVSGLVGGSITLLIVIAVGMLLRRNTRRSIESGGERAGDR